MQVGRISEVPSSRRHSEKRGLLWYSFFMQDVANQDDMQTDHGTQKPLEAMSRPIKNNSKRGESVYDPFGGSGTTLIAAEKLGRSCYMMEIDPRYCDVIRKRYAKLLGKEPEWQTLTALADPPS